LRSEIGTRDETVTGDEERCMSVGGDGGAIIGEIVLTQSWVLVQFQKIGVSERKYKLSMYREKKSCEEKGSCF
jgi:hypothetical protein